MRIHITLTNDDGAVFEGNLDLAPVGAARTARKRATRITNLKAAPKAASAKLDFTKPERAFVKTYSPGLTGPGRLVLLIAYLVKGQVGKEVKLQDVEKRWNKMTSRLGRFNRFYTNGAKENGWVHTTKMGLYVLTPSWKEAFE